MIEIVIQGLPKSPNELVRMHWAQKAKEAKKWRTMTSYVARKFTPKKPFQKVELTFIRGSSRQVDIDNGIASIKPIMDGLRDAKIFMDDNPNIVKTIHFGWEKAPRGQGYIKIIVSPIIE